MWTNKQINVLMRTSNNTWQIKFLRVLTNTWHMRLVKMWKNVWEIRLLKMWSNVWQMRVLKTNQHPLSACSCTVLPPEVFHWMSLIFISDMNNVWWKWWYGINVVSWFLFRVNFVKTNNGGNVIEINRKGFESWLNMSKEVSLVYTNFLRW